jgi:RNA polymerase sigma-70 factor (ECF subfamily)
VNPPSVSSTTATETRNSPELLALVARAQAGDIDAQSALVRRYSRRVSGLVRRIVPLHHAVEDVVQVVFIKMVRRLGSLREPAVFEQWLFALARNAALDFIRRRRCQPTLVFDDLETVAAPDASALAVEEIMAALDRALKHLSPRDRKLVRLIVEGHSYRVAAEREGLSVGAVKVRLHRVRPLLRMCVREAIGARVPADRKWCPPPGGCLAA